MSVLKVALITSYQPKQFVVAKPAQPSRQHFWTHSGDPGEQASLSQVIESSCSFETPGHAFSRAAVVGSIVGLCGVVGEVVGEA
jgi:hypothetical protein